MHATLSDYNQYCFSVKCPFHALVGGNMSVMDVIAGMKGLSRDGK